MCTITAGEEKWSDLPVVHFARRQLLHPAGQRGILHRRISSTGHYSPLGVCRKCHNCGIEASNSSREKHFFAKPLQFSLKMSPLRQRLGGQQIELSMCEWHCRVAQFVTSGASQYHDSSVVSITLPLKSANSCQL